MRIVLDDAKNERSRSLAKGINVSGVYAEDLQPGDEFDLGSHHVTEGEIIAFASTWDPQFFHVDPQRAQSSYFGGVIASGVHTLAVFQRLSVLSQYSEWNVIAGKRIHNLELRQPVHPGDVLTGRFIIDSLEYDDRGRAEIRIRGQLRNQHDKLVLRVDLESLMKTRAMKDINKSDCPR